MTSATPSGRRSATIGSLCGLTMIDIGRAHAAASRDYLHDRDLAMVVEFNSGFGAFGVARHFDLSIGRVVELLDGRSDIAPNRHWRRTPGPRETAVIVALWDRFHSTKYIAQLIGLREQGIVRALTGSGVELRAPEPPDQPPDGFFPGFSAGIGGLHQLCECFGVPAQWGRRWLQAEQLTRPACYKADFYHRDDVRASLMDAGIEPPGYRHLVTTEDT